MNEDHQAALRDYCRAVHGIECDVPRLVAEVRTRNFDLVFHTHPSLRLALMTWLAGIPVRVGTGYRWYSFLFNRKVWEHRSDARFHELEYNLHLLNVVQADEQKRNARFYIGDL